MAIQQELGTVGYTNQGMAEADKMQEHISEFHGPLDDVPSVILQKFGEMRGE